MQDEMLKPETSKWCWCVSSPGIFCLVLFGEGWWVSELANQAAR
jgi:hypothetical protein